MTTFALAMIRTAMATMVLWMAVPVANAVAMRPGKATDASVCDMGHDTTSYLDGQMLVPAVAASKDQIDAYFRMAASFVATRCSNGQLLIVQGSARLSVNSAYLTQLANSACMAADVKHSEVSLTNGARTLPGFELRCTIVKHAGLVQHLADLEKTDPMGALKGRLATAMAQAEGRRSPSDDPASEKKECDKMTLGSLLQGGHCK